MKSYIDNQNIPGTMYTDKQQTGTPTPTLILKVPNSHVRTNEK